MLSIVFFFFFPSGSKAGTEHYCHPRELVGLLASYERWYLGVELALAFNVAVIIALLAYMMCIKSPGGSGFCFRLNCCPGNESEQPREYHHLVPTQNKKSQNLVVDLYSDEPSRPDEELN